MSTKVGLLTTAGFFTFNPSAMARVRCVLPAPSCPTSATTAPGKRSAPSRRPNCVVASRSGISRTKDMIPRRERGERREESLNQSHAAFLRALCALCGEIFLLLRGLVRLRGLEAQVRVHELIEVPVEHVHHVRDLDVHPLALLT